MNKITLNLGGQDREFHFGMGAIGDLLESENIQIGEIQIKLVENYFKWTPLIMYYCLAFPYKRINETVPFDAYEVAEWIDEEISFETKETLVPNKDTGIFEKTNIPIQTVVLRFFEAFWNSMNKNVPEQKEVKKKVTKK